MVSSHARTKEASQAKYISILNIIQGEVDPTQVIEHFVSTVLYSKTLPPAMCFNFRIAVEPFL